MTVGGVGCVGGFTTGTRFGAGVNVRPTTIDGTGGAAFGGYVGGLVGGVFGWVVVVVVVTGSDSARVESRLVTATARRARGQRVEREAGVDHA